MVYLFHAVPEISLIIIIVRQDEKADANNIISSIFGFEMFGLLLVFNIKCFFWNLAWIVITISYGCCYHHYLSLLYTGFGSVIAYIMILTCKGEDLCVQELAFKIDRKMQLLMESEIIT